MSDVNVGHTRSRVARFAAGLLIAVSTAAAATSFAPVNAGASTSQNPGVVYEAHVQNQGWKGYVDSGRTAGTEGLSLRAEAFAIHVTDMPGVKVRCQVFSLAKGGWQAPVDDPTPDRKCGTTGQNMQVESIQLSLVNSAPYYLQFRCHVQGAGWTSWTVGAPWLSPLTHLRVEAIQARLGMWVSGPLPAPNNPSGLTYEGHVQNQGWKGYVLGSETAGTYGQSLRLEAFAIHSVNWTGTIRCQAYVPAKNGWMGTVDDPTPDRPCGTTGIGARIESIKLWQPNNSAPDYGITYRCHVQNKGWTTWVRDGAGCGTAGSGLRIEAIEVGEWLNA